MGALIWAIAGLLFIAAEAISGEFMLLMLGGGALSAALAALLGAPEWLAAVVFALASFVLLAMVRPALKRHLLRRPTVPSNAAALLGARAVPVAPFGDEGGLVRIGADVWSARPATPGHAFTEGEHLVVQRIDGAVAVVDCDFGGHGATGPGATGPVTQRQVEDDDLLAGF